MFDSIQTWLMSVMSSAFLLELTLNHWRRCHSKATATKSKADSSLHPNLLINSSLFCLLLSDEVLQFSGGSFLRCHSCRGIASCFEIRPRLASTQNKNSVSDQILIIPPLIISMRRNVKKKLNKSTSQYFRNQLKKKQKQAIVSVMVFCSGLGAADQWAKMFICKIPIFRW